MPVHPLDGLRAWRARRHRPLAIGHRGVPALAEENTLAGFRLASHLGADLWELDVRLAGDGTCVVCHDDELMRLAGVPERVSALAADELAAIPLHRGGHIPPLADVVALAEQVGAGLYIEIKGTGAHWPAWAALRDARVPAAVLASFQDQPLAELRAAGCTFPLARLVPPDTDAQAAADAVQADIVHLCWKQAAARPQDLVTDALLARAEAAGRAVVLWDEERPAIARDLMAKPVLGICSDQPALLAPLHLPGDPPPGLVFHRGAEAVAPENTYAAARTAFDMGAAYVEVDIRTTSDGVPVAMHDAQVDRTTDGTGAVAALSWADIQRLDAGRVFGPAFAGEPVPRLEALLALAQARGAGLYIEIKAGDAAAIVARVAAAGMLPACFFWAEDPAIMTDLAALSDRPACMRRLEDFADLATALAHAPRVLEVRPAALTSRVLEACRANEIATMAFYGGSEVQLMDGLVRSGADYLNLVRPDLLRQAVI